MFFSVIVPVYKVEEYLPACIESVLNQTFSDFELIKSTHYGKKTFVNILFYEGAEEEI